MFCWQKKKLRYVIIAIFFLSFFIQPLEVLFASSINSEEERLLQLVQGKFEYEGEDYYITEEAIYELQQMLMQDDIDLTAEQVNKVIDEGYNNLAFGIESGYLIKILDSEKKDEKNSELVVEQPSITPVITTPKAETNAEANAEIKAETKSESKAETKEESKAETKKETKTETNAKTNAELEGMKSEGESMKDIQFPMKDTGYSLKGIRIFVIAFLVFTFAGILGAILIKTLALYDE